MRALMLEDDDLLRSSISSALRLEGIQVVGQARDAATAVRLAEMLAPDAIVVDIDLGVGPTGLDAAARVRQVLPSIGIVVLTGFDDPRLAGSNRRQLPEDAEYLVKGSIANVGLVARAIIRAVGRMRDESANTTAARMDGSRTSRLSDTQIAIWRLVAEGLTNSQIARARGVSEKSVEHAISRLARGLDIDVSQNMNLRVILARRFFELTAGGRVPD